MMMNGPPKDLPATELWMKLQIMPRPNRIVDFPRQGLDGNPVGQVAIQVLTQEEQMICASAAERFTKDKIKDGKKDDLGYETVYANASVVEILFRACRDEKDVQRPAFPSPGAIRNQLTADECGRLFEHYLSTQLELGPIVAQLSKEEMDAWIDRIAAGGLAASPFILLSPDMQRILAHTMACRLVASRTDKSSAGSPPDEMPNDDASNDGSMKIGDDLDEEQPSTEDPGERDPTMRVRKFQLPGEE